MSLFGRRAPPSPSGGAIDEFLGDGEVRAATPLELDPASSRWMERLARTPAAPGSVQEARRALALPAFSLLSGGDLFESSPRARRPRTERALLDRFLGEQLRPVPTRASNEASDAAHAGLARVLAGNPALCRRMLLVRPIELVVLPPGQDFRAHGFPPSTNPLAVGLFYAHPDAPRARLGLREERVLEKPWLMAHELTHAVHLLALTHKERDVLDRFLRPVYLSTRGVEEGFAIYAERAFGARYDDADLAAPGIYGKTRRDWDPQHVFSRFVLELFRPA